MPIEGASQVGVTLGRLRDERMGALLAERVRAGQDAFGEAHALARLTDTARELRLSFGTPPTDEQKAKLLDAWTAKRATVANLYTSAQLAAEVALARRTAFKDFEGIPARDEVNALILQLDALARN